MSKPPTYRFVVRLPAHMKDQILEAARLYRRSMNSEIVARLQASLEGLPSTDETRIAGSGRPNESPDERPNESSEARYDGRYEIRADAPLNLTLERVLRTELSVEEAALLRCFRKLAGSKRAALLKLLT